jgi:hypothetical protein
MASWFRRSHRQDEGGGCRLAVASSVSEPAWWHVMGYDAGPPRSLVQVERRFRHLAARAHPDRGGSAEVMQRLIRARLQARRQLTP